MAAHQNNHYKATPTEIEGGLYQGSIELNNIILIDLDNADTATLQKYKSEIQQLRQVMQESA